MPESKPPQPALRTPEPVATHPGFRLLTEVTRALSSAAFSEQALANVASILTHALGNARCRIWIRDEDGASYRAIAGPGDQSAPEAAGEVAAIVRGGVPESPESWDALDIRVPLEYQGEKLGLLDVRVARDGREAMARDVLTVVANVLSPLLASRELSQDLAGEVARRAREIEAQRRFTAKVIDSLPVGLYVIDRDYRIQAWNRKRETGTQGVPREEAIGQPIFEVLHRQPRDLLRHEFDEVLNTGQIQEIELESTATGEARHYRITKIPMHLDDAEVSHVITIGEDITESKEAQARIAQSEKLAAIGQLAAGIMHEINNPLATIGACTEALGGRVENASKEVRAGVEEYLKIIESEVERCTHIVDGLLDFSRPRVLEVTSTDVNKVVDETLFLLKHHERFKLITLKRELDERLPRILGNAERLIQVFMSLMLNAVDAMDSRGTLTVRTRVNPERGDEVMIQFSDTGKGIPRHQLAKVFEPFFTTKPGRGTGLGLSVGYGIIAEHGGRIDVESQPGLGSTFTVIIPVGENPRH